MNRLISKLSDPDFLDYINSVILSETWLSHKSAYNLNIEGYFNVVSLTLTVRVLVSDRIQ